MRLFAEIFAFLPLVLLFLIQPSLIISTSLVKYYINHLNLVKEHNEVRTSCKLQPLKFNLINFKQFIEYLHFVLFVILEFVNIFYKERPATIICIQSCI